MYRQPNNGMFRYLCGLYQQSHGPVPPQPRRRATRDTFSVERDPSAGASPAAHAKLKQKLFLLAECEQSNVGFEDPLASKLASLKEVQRKLEKTAENMALADNEQQFQAMAAVFDDLKLTQKALEGEIVVASTGSKSSIRKRKLTRRVQMQIRAAIPTPWNVLVPIGKRSR
jgi:hypothetical protein